LGFGRRRDNQKDCRRINRSCEKASRILVQVCEVAYWHISDLSGRSDDVCHCARVDIADTPAGFRKGP
jgi:hypothetical protein